MLLQRMAAGVVFLVLALTSYAQTNRIRLAAEARFDLYATTNVGALQQGEILGGLGNAGRIAWMKPTDQVRAYSFSFPISHFSTNELVVRFVPQEAGRVTLSLLGPYERVPSDKEAIYQEEVLWDQLDVAGASLVPESAALLRLPARSWFRQRYDLGLVVQARVPVTLRCMARSSVPADFQEPKSIADTDSPAHRAARKLQRGVSLAQSGDLLRRNGTISPFGDDDFANMRREGFDHVRLPVAWHLQTSAGPEFKIASELFARVDLVVAKAAKQELGVVLGCQEFDGLYQNPSLELPRFIAIWRQVATHYNDFPANLSFELISPAGNRGITLALNGHYSEALRAIRGVSPDRAVLMSPGRLGSPWELSRLQLPEWDANIIVSLHSREPEPFTQQMLVASGSVLSAIRFPGPPESPASSESMAALDLNTREWIGRYQTLPPERNPSGPQFVRGLVRFAQQWSEHSGRPIYFADWGCPQQIEAGSRARYYSAWREALSEARVGWGVLDWKQGCRYWDEKTSQPMVGLREALFPGRPATPAVPESSEPIRSAMRELQDLRKEVRQTGLQSTVDLQALRIHASEMQEQSMQTQHLARWLTAIVLTLAIVVILLVAFRPRADVGILPPVLANLPAEGVRQGTLAHLARMMMDRLVQKLLSDRRASMDIQEHAAQDLAEMERRLERLQAPIQDRMMIYQKRVMELERELSKKGEENRELIRAKIALTKERLAATQSAAPAEWRLLHLENFEVQK